MLTENLEIVIIELPKMKKYKIKNKKLESWLKFIKNPNSLGAKELGENKEIQKAKEEYDKVMADDHERDLIRLREKYWLDYNSMKNASYKSGKEAGIEERNKATEKRMEPRRKKTK